MELNQLIRDIQKLELLCKSISGQRLSGIFKSLFKGKGLVLDSVRKYETGDDIRDINWSATARFRESYVNTFAEDKERLIWLLVDVSKSGMFGTVNKTKFDLSIEIAATLAYSALESKNTVGVLLFNNEVKEVIPPARGNAHFWHIARHLVDTKPCGEGTHIATALQYFMRVGNRHSSVYIISDFLCDSYKPYLKVLAQQHEVTAIRVYDEAETVLPALAWANLRDAETGKSHWVNTLSTGYMSICKENALQAANNFKVFFDSNNASSLSIHTGENFMERLIAFMQN